MVRRLSSRHPPLSYFLPLFHCLPALCCLLLLLGLPAEGGVLPASIPTHLWLFSPTVPTPRNYSLTEHTVLGLWPQTCFLSRFYWKAQSYHLNEAQWSSQPWSSLPQLEESELRLSGIIPLPLPHPIHHPVSLTAPLFASQICIPSLAAISALYPLTSSAYICPNTPKHGTILLKMCLLELGGDSDSPRLAPPVYIATRKSFRQISLRERLCFSSRFQSSEVCGVVRHLDLW